MTFHECLRIYYSCLVAVLVTGPSQNKGNNGVAGPCCYRIKERNDACR